MTPKELMRMWLTMIGGMAFASAWWGIGLSVTFEADVGKLMCAIPAAVGTLAFIVLTFFAFAGAIVGD